MTSLPSSRAERSLTAFMKESERSSINNPIHSSDGGREYGFKTALVPGVTVYGWAVPAIMKVLGEDWVGNGWVEFALVHAVYPGDVVRIVVEARGDGSCDLSVINQDNEMCLIGAVGTGAAPWLEELHNPSRRAVEPLQSEYRPPLTLENAPVGEDIQPMAVEVSAESQREIAVQRLADDHPLFVGDSPILHPAAHVNLTELIKRAYDFAPSIHTKSRIQYLRRSATNQTITIAAHCVEAYERRGHSYISVDGVIIDENNEECIKLRHTVIFNVAKRI